MSVPGAGLLALLRARKPDQEPPSQLGVVTTAATAGGSTPGNGNKFEARSSAVHALEQAVAAGTIVEVARVQAQGRRIPPGPSYTYDVDVHVPHEAQPQLPVTPVTLINTDFALHHWRQIAVSPRYICYGLKQGHIRVLSRSSAIRALLKAHTQPLTDLQFAGGDGEGSGDGSELLASGGADGQLHVWRLVLDEDAAAIQDRQQLRATFVSAAGRAGGVLLSWHAPSKRVLAVGVGGRVLLVVVPSDGGMEQLEFDLDDESTPDAAVLPGWTGEAVTCLSFSPDGQLLAAGGASGTVRVWQLRASAAAGASGEPRLAPVGSVGLPAATSGVAVGAVCWLPQPQGAGWALLTGNKNNSSLQLWHSQAPSEAAGWQLVQGLRFEGKDGQQEFWNHADMVPAQQLVVLADTQRKAVYTLHYTGAGADLRFDYAARFGVAVPILSFTTSWNPAGGEQGDSPVVELSCVQTTAVQQYSLDPALCSEGDEGSGEAEDAEEAGVARRSSLLERHGRDLGIQPQPTSSVPMPSEHLARGAGSAANTPRSSSAASVPAPGLPSPAAVAAAELAAEPFAAADASGSEAVAEVVGGAEVAPPPPPTVEPSIEGVVPLLAGIPLPPGPEGELQPKGASGEVTPEECPSPPPTPTEQLRTVDDQLAAVPEVQVQAAANGANAAPPPPQPRLLTPSDLLLRSSGSGGSDAARATASRASAASPSSEVSSSSQRRGPSPAQPPVRVLQRPASMQATAAPEEEQEPLPPAAASAAEAEQLPALSPEAAAATSAPAVGASGDASLAAAVAEQMGGVHKKFVGHVSLMYRELLKAMKAEMAAQAAAQQAALAQLLAAQQEAHRQQVEAERAAVLAEERASIERLLTAISATLNRDLPAKLAEAVRGEVEGAAAGLAAAVAPALEAGLAAALPKELPGAVKAAALDKALVPAVTTALNKPLQEAFRGAFAKQLVPAFEAATQSMFQQINTAVAAGLEEHLQASRSALAEPAHLATQLAASLSTAQSLAASLSQGQQQLLRAQSLTGSDARSPMATADIRNELSALLRAGKYEQAFTRALGLQDIATVGWLATQADAASVLGKDPCPLSQTVLLSLVQQLSADLCSHLGAKLAWIREAALLINPGDPMLARHLRPVLESVYAALQAAAGRLHGAEASSCKLAMHVVHSQLTS